MMMMTNPMQMDGRWTKSDYYQDNADHDDHEDDNQYYANDNDDDDNSHAN